MAAKPTALKQTTADSGPPSVLGMELDPQSGYSRIRVHMSRPANFDSHMLKNPDRLYIDIFDAQVANQLARKDWGIRDVRIRDVRLGKQGETGTRIVFDLTQPVLYSVLHDLHRSELIIELRDLPTKK